MNKDIPLGTVKLSVQTWQHHHSGKWAVIIRQHTRVRFKRSGRIGWRFDGWPEKFKFDGYHDTRIAAKRAGREAIKNS